MQSEWKKVSEFQRNVDVVSKSSNWGKVGRELRCWVNNLKKSHDCAAVYVHAHNGLRYDFPIIVCENERFEIKQPKNWRIVDTLKTFDELVQRPPKSNRKLGTFHLAATKKLITNQHTALPDAQALASIYLTCSLNKRNDAVFKWNRGIEQHIRKYARRNISGTGSADLRSPKMSPSMDFPRRRGGKNV